MMAITCFLLFTLFSTTANFLTLVFTNSEWPTITASKLTCYGALCSKVCNFPAKFQVFPKTNAFRMEIGFINSGIDPKRFQSSIFEVDQHIRSNFMTRRIARSHLFTFLEKQKTVTFGQDLFTIFFNLFCMAVFSCALCIFSSYRLSMT